MWGLTQTKWPYSFICSSNTKESFVTNFGISPGLCHSMPCDHRRSSQKFPTRRRQDWGLQIRRRNGNSSGWRIWICGSHYLSLLRFPASKGDRPLPGLAERLCKDGAVSCKLSASEASGQPALFQSSKRVPDQRRENQHSLPSERDHQPEIHQRRCWYVLHRREPATVQHGSGEEPGSEAFGVLGHGFGEWASDTFSHQT